MIRNGIRSGCRGRSRSRSIINTHYRVVTVLRVAGCWCMC
jgi:hypothetical protein